MTTQSEAQLEENLYRIGRQMRRLRQNRSRRWLSMRMNTDLQ